MLNIVWKSKIWFTTSLILIFISIWSMIFNKIDTWNFLNFWIDFSGWTMMEVEFPQKIDQKNLLENLEKEFPDFYPKIQSTWENKFFIKTKALEGDNHKIVLDKIEQDFWKFEEVQFNTIWPSIWEKMKSNALIALIVALITIILYIAFAFRNLPDELSSWNFWFTAIAALAHDIIITIWAFSLMWIFTWIEIDALFITALLTVMWFSVHDTIVVFDRLRENTHKKIANQTFEEIANNSVNQTIDRSINTSVSTLFPLVALYIFWSESVEMFILALIVWIVIWTYSSIFLATPLLVSISHKWELSDIVKRKN